MHPKHTPGPWYWANGDVICAHVGERISEIADLRPQRGPQSALSPNKDEFEANAHLIAAAPELLALIDRLVGTWDNYEDMGPDPLDPIVEAARKTIAKARGEG